MNNGKVQTVKKTQGRTKIESGVPIENLKDCGIGGHVNFNETVSNNYFPVNFYTRI